MIVIDLAILSFQTDKTDSNLLKKNNKSDEDVNMDETEKEKRRKILERNRCVYSLK